MDMSLKTQCQWACGCMVRPLCCSSNVSLHSLLSRINWTVWPPSKFGNQCSRVTFILQITVSLFRSFAFLYYFQNSCVYLGKLIGILIEIAQEPYVIWGDTELINIESIESDSIKWYIAFIYVFEFFLVWFWEDAIVYLWRIPKFHVFNVILNSNIVTVILYFEVRAAWLAFWCVFYMNTCVHSIFLFLISE